MLGEGPPLVKTANWLNHIEHDWESPLWRHWLDEFTDGRSLIRYDERGNGLSDWDTPELSFEAFIDDLECVADCLALERFDLLAISQGAAVAVAYAVRHPDRVRRLVICNGYAAGWAVRSDPSERARREAMVTLTQLGWGASNPAYRQLFTNHYVPDATPKQMGWFNEMQRLSASPENAVRLQRVLSQIDARELLPKVRTPTLIFHSRDDQAVPFSQGEELAAKDLRGELHPARKPQPYPAPHRAGVGNLRAGQQRLPEPARSGDGSADAGESRLAHSRPAEGKRRRGAAVAARKLGLVSDPAMLDAVGEAGIRRLTAEMKVGLARMAHRPFANAVVQFEQAGLVGDLRARLGGHEAARRRGRDRRLLIARALADEAAGADRAILHFRRRARRKSSQEPRRRRRAQELRLSALRPWGQPWPPARSATAGFFTSFSSPGFTGEGRCSRPRRCALPITALRLTPPSSSAI